MNSNQIFLKSSDWVRPTILIVDDAPENLTLMSGLLKDVYRVKVTISGEKALEIANTSPPDLILLDIVMPRMDGYQTCEKLKSNPATHDIPVIFLTSATSSDDEEHGLKLGAVDYITKPVTAAILRARVATHLQLKASADFLRDQSRFLSAEVTRRINQIQSVQDVTLQVMASLAETRDNDTGNHIRRTQYYVRTLANRLREHPRFAPYLQQEGAIDALFKSAALHDIGKIGIPDSILMKPGKLTTEEFEIMKTHTTIGSDSFERVERLMGQATGFLTCAKEIACGHHEKWDGSGYPKRFSGEEIPISARLMAVADVYDAMISRRVYKPCIPHETVRDVIMKERARHFDPDVVDAFLAEENQFVEIATRFFDEAQESRSMPGSAVN